MRCAERGLTEFARKHFLNVRHAWRRAAAPGGDPISPHRTRVQAAAWFEEALDADPDCVPALLAYAELVAWRPAFVCYSPVPRARCLDEQVPPPPFARQRSRRRAAMSDGMLCVPAGAREGAGARARGACGDRRDGQAVDAAVRVAGAGGSGSGVRDARAARGPNGRRVHGVVREGTAGGVRRGTGAGWCVCVGGGEEGRGGTHARRRWRWQAGSSGAQQTRRRTYRVRWSCTSARWRSSTRAR